MCGFNNQMKTTRLQDSVVMNLATGFSDSYLMILLLKFLVQRHCRIQARQKVWQQEDRMPNLRSDGFAFSTTTSIQIEHTWTTTTAPYFTGATIWVTALCSIKSCYTRTVSTLRQSKVHVTEDESVAATTTWLNPPCPGWAGLQKPSPCRLQRQADTSADTHRCC